MTRAEHPPAFLALALLALLPFGCVVAGSPMGVEYKARTQFESEWSKYRKLAPNKAMAIAGDIHGRYVLGYAHVFPSEASAIEEALSACELRREDRRVVAPCKLFAVNEVRVEPERVTPDD